MSTLKFILIQIGLILFCGLAFALMHVSISNEKPNSFLIGMLIGMYLGIGGIYSGPLKKKWFGIPLFIGIAVIVSNCVAILSPHDISISSATAFGVLVGTLTIPFRKIFEYL